MRVTQVKRRGEGGAIEKGRQKQCMGKHHSEAHQTLGIALDNGYPNKALLMHWLVLINLFCIKPSTSAGPALMCLSKMKGLAPFLKIYLRLLPNRWQFMFTYTMYQGNLSMKLPANVCFFSNNNSSSKENLIAKSPGRLY